MIEDVPVLHDRTRLAEGADLFISIHHADERNGVHHFDNLAVARTATMPALLVEAGVIVNRDEELRLRDPEVRGRIARAIARGVGRCLQ